MVRMNAVLEWYQCSKCGRRYRWRPELVGTVTDCACGVEVECPDIQHAASLSSAGLDDTVGGSTMTGSSVVAASQHEGIEVEVEPDRVETAEPVRYRRHGQVSWHRHINTKALCWTAAALVGLAVGIFAVIMNEWPYWVAAGLVTPFTFWRWWCCERIWQGPRSLARAVEETLGEAPATVEPSNSE